MSPPIECILLKHETIDHIIRIDVEVAVGSGQHLNLPVESPAPCLVQGIDEAGVGWTQAGFDRTYGVAQAQIAQAAGWLRCQVGCGPCPYAAPVSKRTRSPSLGSGGKAAGSNSRSCVGTVQPPRSHSAKKDRSNKPL